MTTKTYKQISILLETSEKERADLIRSKLKLSLRDIFVVGLETIEEEMNDGKIETYLTQNEQNTEGT